MEASDAGLTQDTTADQEPVGNGIVVVCGIFEPGAVVELYQVDSDVVKRAEGGRLVGRRIANDAREVGFDGLTPGDRFFATGYTGGELKEVRTRAQDPSAGITLFQQPVQPSPTTVGTQQTQVADAPPAAPAGDVDGVGLPDGVVSPILAGDESTATPGSPPARDDAGVSPGDIDVVAGSAAAQPEATEEYVYEGAGEPDSASWAKADVQEKVTPEDAEQEPRALYRFTGDRSALETFPPEGFVLYEGPTEPVPAATDTASDASSTGAPDAGPSQTTDPAPSGTDATVVAAGTDAPAQAVSETVSVTISENGEGQTTISYAPERVTIAKQPEHGTASIAPVDGSPTICLVKVVNATAGETASVEVNVAAPQAGAPDASESSGTGQANGGAVEQAPDATPAADAAPVEGQTTTTSASQPADGSAETAPADAAAADTAPAAVDPAAADAAPAADSSPAPASDWDKLASQAIDLGVTNTATMSAAELRQAITEKNATPVV